MTEQIWDRKTIGLGPSTMVATTEGTVPVEWLSPSHHLLTRDHGPHPVLEIEPHILCPKGGAYVPLVVVEPDALGVGMPDHAVTLPPHHRVLLEGAQIELNFGHDAALSHCADLVDGTLIRRSNIAADVTFYTVHTQVPVVIWANGMWVETMASPDASPYPCLTDWEGRMLARERATDVIWTTAQVA